MYLIYLQISFLVFVVILTQFIIKWLFGVTVSREDMHSQSRKDYHMLRRIQHMSTGLAMLIIWPLVSCTLALFGLGIGTICFFSMNLYRIYNKEFNEKYLKNFGFLLRPHEINNMPGALYFLIGMFFSALFYGRIEVYLATIVLSFGDPFASLCGIYFKSPKISKDKTIAGTICCGLISVLIAGIFYLFVNEFEIVRKEVGFIEFEFVTFVIAVLAELGPSWKKFKLEDNFTIPIYTGFLFKIYFEKLKGIKI